MADPFAEYVRAHADRCRRERQAAARRAAEARAAAEAAARRIGARTGARRVILFGSLARNEFHERSDIDLAVEELPDGAWIDALAAADGTPFEMQVVPLEWAPAYIREAVAREGVVLWSR
ncbi:MAG: nucleotidyltransferase domain-containing protein [Myxococcales bacterium]|nr:nucleotidyltransferase domain-containing protein [Myxococcales bacterium]